MNEELFSPRLVCPPTLHRVKARFAKTAYRPKPSQLARSRTGAGGRLLLIGHTDGRRALTLVIERTVDPTSWLIVTGWIATERGQQPGEVVSQLLRSA